MNIKKLVNFLFELGQLKHVKHDGWRLIGVKNLHSVSEHSLRAAQIGYFLAKMEGYKNPYEIVTMAVFHDIGECRIGDINKIANRYINADEERAVKEQLSPVEDDNQIFNLWKETEEKSTKAEMIAKDADLLEQCLSSKEFIEQGHKSAQDWIDNVLKLLKTDSGKKLLKEIKNGNSNDWWQGLKKIN